MSTWPTGTLEGNWTASPAAVERVSMESGPDKQSNPDGTAQIEIPVTYHFEAAQWVIWKAWFFGEINRSGWFNWTEPDTGALVRARVKNGEIRYGPTTSTKACYRARMIIEYLR